MLASSWGASAGWRYRVTVAHIGAEGSYSDQSHPGGSEPILGTATVDNAPERLRRAKGSLLPSRAARGLSYAYVSNVAVAESARRKGIASALVAAAEATAAEWRCRGVALHCLSSDAGSLRMCACPPHASCEWCWK